jgi:hypothetical protein
LQQGLADHLDAAFELGLDRARGAEAAELKHLLAAEGAGNDRG